MKKLFTMLLLANIGLVASAQEGKTLKGDLNGDGKVDIVDVTTLIDMILYPAPESYLSCPDSHHPHMIDLGLLSGTKWACCNVEASTPEDYGGYFAWGEVATKEVYNWDTYTHFDGSGNTCHDIGSDIAETQYDAATANWGTPWRMPTIEQCEELINNTTSEWTAQNGVHGRKFTGKNGGIIFLPAAGFYWDDQFYSVGSGGYYWSSTLCESNPYGAFGLYFGSGYAYWYDYSYRNLGQSVRPVRNN